MCAERVAIFKAVSEDTAAFRRIAIVADTPAPTPPCGACRQILWEFAGDIEVILANLTQETGRHRVTDCCRCRSMRECSRRSRSVRAHEPASQAAVTSQLGASD